MKLILLLAFCAALAGGSYQLSHWLFGADQSLTSGAAPASETPRSEKPTSITNMPPAEIVPALIATEAVARMQELSAQLTTASAASMPAFWKAHAAEPLLQELVAHRWVELSMEGFIEFLHADTQPSTLQRRFEYATLLIRGLAERDPEMAMQVAAREQQHSGFQSTPFAALEVILAKNLMLAVQLSQKYHASLNGVFASDLIGEVVQPKEALDAMVAPPASTVWREAIPEIIRQWTIKDNAACAHWLEQHPALRDEMLPAMALTLAPSAPQETLEALFEISGNLSLEKSREQVMRIWLEKDPAAAVMWMKGRRFFGNKFFLSEALHTSEVSFNLPVLADAIAKMDYGPMREDALRTVADLWARKDAAAALAWTKTLPEDRDSWALRQSMLNGMVSDHLDLTLNYDLGGMPKKMRERLAESIASTAGDQASRAGYQWIFQQPAAQQGDLLGSYMSGFAGKKGLDATVAVLKIVPSNELRLKAVTDILHGYVEGDKDISEAIRWTNNLNDASLRAMARKVLTDPETMAESTLERTRKELK